MVFLKRNANAFSLNAIVNVRLRRHEMIFNISKTMRDNDLKIYDRIALKSVYILTGNDVINYFRSEANRINVYILGQVQVAIPRYWLS